MMKKHSRIKRWLIITAPFLCSAFAVRVSTIVVSAAPVLKESQKSFLPQLIAYQDYLEQNNIISYAIRALGWLLVQFLMMLCDAANALLDKAFAFLNFTEYGKIGSFIKTVQPLLFTVFAVALLFWAYQKIINPAAGGEILTNVVVALLVITALPQALLFMNDVVRDSKTFLEKQQSTAETSNSENIVARSVTDVLIADAKGWPIKKNGKASVKESDMSMKDNAAYIVLISPTDLIDGDNDVNPYTDKDVNEQITDYALKHIPQSGNSEGLYYAEEIDDGIMKDFPPATGRYYRYQVDWLPCYISLIAWIIVYFFSSYKTVRIIFELVQSNIVAPFFAVGDISNGKKARQVLTGILSSYIVLIVIILIQNLFIYAENFLYLSAEEGGLGLTSFQRSVFLIFLALAVVDGPAFIEQVLGIDAGLKGGFGLFAVLRTVKSTAMAPLNAAQRLYNPFGSYGSYSRMMRGGNGNSSPQQPNEGMSHRQEGASDNLTDEHSEATDTELGKDNLDNRNNENSDMNMDNVTNDNGTQQGKDSDGKDSLYSSGKNNESFPKGNGKEGDTEISNSSSDGNKNNDPSMRFGKEGVNDLFTGPDGKDNLSGSTFGEERGKANTSGLNDMFANELRKNNLKSSVSPLDNRNPSNSDFGKIESGNDFLRASDRKDNLEE